MREGRFREVSHSKIVYVLTNDVCSQNFAGPYAAAARTWATKQNDPMYDMQMTSVGVQTLRTHERAARLMGHTARRPRPAERRPPAPARPKVTGATTSTRTRERWGASPTSSSATGSSPTGGSYLRGRINDTQLNCTARWAARRVRLDDAPRAGRAPRRRSAFVPAISRRARLEIREDPAAESHAVAKSRAFSLIVATSFGWSRAQRIAASRLAGVYETGT